MTANTYLVEVDSEGNELRRWPVEITATVETEPDYRPTPLPATLDWYRDAARWWTTAAAALLVFGIGYLPSADEGGLRLVFLTAGLLLIVSVGIGIYYHVCILELGKSWENLNALDDDHQEGSNDERREKEQEHFDKTLGKLGWLHYPLFATFAAGFAVLACSIALSLLEEGSPSSQFLLQTDSADRVLLLDSRSGETWTLAPDGADGYEWTRLAPAVRSSDPDQSN